MTPLCSALKDFFAYHDLIKTTSNVRKKLIENHTNTSKIVRRQINILRSLERHLHKANCSLKRCKLEKRRVEKEYHCGFTTYAHLMGMHLLVKQSKLEINKYQSARVKVSDRLHYYFDILAQINALLETQRFNYRRIERLKRRRDCAFRRLCAQLV